MELTMELIAYILTRSCIHDHTLFYFIFNFRKIRKPLLRVLIFAHLFFIKFRKDVFVNIKDLRKIALLRTICLEDKYQNRPRLIFESSLPINFFPKACTQIQSVRSLLAKRKLSLTPSRFEIKTGNSFCRWNLVSHWEGNSYIYI